MEIFIKAGHSGSTVVKQMTELKRCPHCNGKVQLEDHFRLGFIIYCEKCEAIFMLDDYEATEKELIEAWNRRTGNE